ncbi:MAG: hypothetical protein LBN23_06035 [Paludibacter sp.]|jgi:hypothetical protein|nr:hypothetical protein [Paludibacter sp.]
MKTNKKLTQIVAGTIATSVLVSSCDLAQLSYNLDNNVYEQLAANKIAGTAMFDINKSNLSDEVIQKTVIISKLVEELVNDNALAKQFTENPKEYLKQRGWDLEINLSDYEISALRAFGDDDVMASIKNDDLPSFLRICKEKGYIGLRTDGGISATPDDIRALFRSDEDYNQFLDYIERNDLDINNVAGLFAFAIVALGLVVVAAGAITVELYVFIQAVAIYHIAVHTAGPQPPDTCQNHPIINLWFDNNKNFDTTFFYNDMIEEDTKFITNSLLRQFPDMDRHTLETLIKSNLTGYYGNLQ